MGKSINRLRTRRITNSINMTRGNAIAMACTKLFKNPSSRDGRNIITMFGLSAEELSESGLSYEMLRALDGIIS